MSRGGTSETRETTERATKSSAAAVVMDENPTKTVPEQTRRASDEFSNTKYRHKGGGIDCRLSIVNRNGGFFDGGVGQSRTLLYLAERRGKQSKWMELGDALTKV